MFTHTHASSSRFATCECLNDLSAECHAEAFAESSLLISCVSPQVCVVLNNGPVLTSVSVFLIDRSSGAPGVQIFGVRVTGDFLSLKDAFPNLFEVRHM